MSDNGSAGGKPDVDALRAEIRQTRAELGATVQALAAKADVKARARESVQQTTQRVRAQAVQATETARERSAPVVARLRRDPVAPVAVFVGVTALVVVLLIVRGRRR